MRSDAEKVLCNPRLRFRLVTGRFEKEDDDESSDNCAVEALEVDDLCSLSKSDGFSGEPGCIPCFALIFTHAVSQFGVGMFAELAKGDDGGAGYSTDNCTSVEDAMTWQSL